MFRRKEQIRRLDNETLEDMLGDEIEHLIKYLKIDTSNPPGKIDAAVEFFEEIYKKEGIPYEIVTNADGKKSIWGYIYSAKNSDSEAIILLNHMDVVPAVPEEWNMPPFSGQVYDNKIWGRGAIDMKGLAIIQLASALLIKRKGIRLKYNIIILSVPDEETGGFEGAKYVTDNYLFKLNPAFVLDEGAFGFNEKGMSTIYLSYSQKKTLWLKLEVLGKGGHGACPKKSSPNESLIDILAILSKNKFLYTDSCGDLFVQSFTNKGRMILGLLKWARKIGILKMILDIQTKKKFERNFYYNTISITSVKSGIVPNVIPNKAEVILDCRLLPDENVDEFIAFLKFKLRKHGLLFQVIKRTDSVESSECNNDIVENIHSSIKQNYPQCHTKNIVSHVGTDSKYFRSKGIKAYGFFPILLNVEEFEMMHGKNEYISIENIKRATKIISEFLFTFEKGD